MGYTQALFMALKAMPVTLTSAQINPLISTILLHPAQDMDLCTKMWMVFALLFAQAPDSEAGVLATMNNILAIDLPDISEYGHDTLIGILFKVRKRHLNRLGFNFSAQALAAEQQGDERAASRFRDLDQYRLTALDPADRNEKLVYLQRRQRQTLQLYSGSIALTLGEPGIVKWMDNL